MSLYCSNAGSYLLKQIEKIRPGVTNSSTQYLNFTDCRAGTPRKNSGGEKAHAPQLFNTPVNLLNDEPATTWGTASDLASHMLQECRWEPAGRACERSALQMLGFCGRA